MSRTIFSKRQEAFQKLFRGMRLEAGMTQLELATRLQRPQSFVSKVESGERILNIIELKEACDALGVLLLEFVSKFENQSS
jgi:transcriptional regulator with XRE-family HTH domain